MSCQVFVGPGKWAHGSTGCP